MPAFLRLLTRRLVSVVGFSLGLLLVVLVGASADIAVVPADGGSPSSPPGPTASRAERLFSAHDCWTGAAPPDLRGGMPGHVIVSRPGRAAVHSARLVQPALAQVFSDDPRDDRGLLVHAFCR